MSKRTSSLRLAFGIVISGCFAVRVAKVIMMGDVGTVLAEVLNSWPSRVRGLG